VILSNLSREVKINDNQKCCWCKNYCKQAVACKSKEILKLNKCFWEEQTTEIVIYKNDNILKYESISITTDFFKLAPYGFWKHIDNSTKEEKNFLNTVSRRNIL
jgi:hypothetical protein